MEIWKDIKGYDGYQVSNMGRVWSIHSQKHLKPRPNKQGYLRVCIKANNGKYKDEYIHRLVAIAFIDNPYQKPQVNHKNETITDNRADNLEWVTSKENINYGNHSLKCSISRGKPVICVETGIEYHSAREAGKHFNNNHHISEACNTGGVAAGYHWKWKEQE